MLSLISLIMDIGTEWVPTYAGLLSNEMASLKGVYHKNYLGSAMLSVDRFSFASHLTPHTNLNLTQHTLPLIALICENMKCTIL